MSTEKNTIQGSAITAIPGTTLNALANNAVALGSAINWTQGQTADGYLMGRVQLTFKFQSGPSTNTGFSIWFIKSTDGGGTTEDSTAAPPRAPDLTFLGHAYGGSGDTNAHVVSADVLIPVGSIKFLLKNDGTGQALSASNTDNVLTVVPLTPQVV